MANNGLIMMDIPSGNLLHNYGKIHHLFREISHEKWWFSIVMLVYQRVVTMVCSETWLINYIYTLYSNEIVHLLTKHGLPNVHPTGRLHHQFKNTYHFTHHFTKQLG